MRFLFLAAPGLVVLAAPLYNSVEPSFFGVPFFYWFQLVMVPVSALGILAFDRMSRG